MEVRLSVGKQGPITNYREIVAGVSERIAEDEHVCVATMAEVSWAQQEDWDCEYGEEKRKDVMVTGKDCSIEGHLPLGQMNLVFLGKMQKD